MSVKNRVADHVFVGTPVKLLAPIAAAQNAVESHASRARFSISLIVFFLILSSDALRKRLSTWEMQQHLQLGLLKRPLQ